MSKNRAPAIIKIRGVIFDLDGILIDSEKFYFRADQRMLQEYGIEFTREMKKEYIGCGNLDMMKIIRDKYDLPETPAGLLKKKNSYYLEMARREIETFPKTVRLLKRLSEEGYPLALASGSSPAVIDELLTITGLKGCFSHIISSEEVKRGKPDPQVFLESARRLALSPESCVVIEDSTQGVEAAKSGGMLCIAIPSTVEKPLHPSFHLADLLFEGGMEEFDEDEAFRWITISGLC
ncbi:MAG: HAD family hydrolase [Dethiobacteria bacterium]